MRKGGNPVSHKNGKKGIRQSIGKKKSAHLSLGSIDVPGWEPEYSRLCVYPPSRGKVTSPEECLYIRGRGNPDIQGEKATTIPGHGYSLNDNSDHAPIREVDHKAKRKKRRDDRERVGTSHSR